MRYRSWLNRPTCVIGSAFRRARLCAPTTLLPLFCPSWHRPIENCCSPRTKCQLRHPEGAQRERDAHLPRGLCDSPLGSAYATTSRSSPKGLVFVDELTHPYTSIDVLSH